MDGTMKIGDSLTHMPRSIESKNLTDKAGNSAKEIHRLSREFESIFLQFVLKSMRDTVPKSSFLKKGNGEEIFKSLLDGQYATEMANQESTGIAKAVQKQLMGILQAGKPVNNTSEGLAIYAKKADKPLIK